MRVVIAPNQILRTQTKPVKKISPGLLNTFKEMAKLTLTFKDPEGIGLASNQAGLTERFFIAKNGEGFLTVINPKILKTYKRVKKQFEGCLSIPNYWGEINRFSRVKVSYQDETGKEHIETLTGLLAWIFQHEIDHLDGKLFPDRVLEQKGRFFKFTGKDKTGRDTFEEVTI